jgi:hypothetical protein
VLSRKFEAVRLNEPESRFHATLVTNILATNRGRCPLTDLASRYTEERADNFHNLDLKKVVARWQPSIDINHTMDCVL